MAGRKPPMAKRGYHHGNLRQALVDAALKLIEAKGPTGFTLSEAAKNAMAAAIAGARVFVRGSGRIRANNAGGASGGALATAQRYAFQSSPKDTLRHATRALDLLPVGSPGWLKADDIRAVAERSIRAKN